MNGKHLEGAERKRGSVVRPGSVADARHFHGIRVVGRITKLLTGQSFGFIRLSDKRAVFFHRSDVQEGTRFNDLNVGDAVTFELLEDAISGARAVHVARR